MIKWPDLKFPPINLWTVWKRDMKKKVMSPCRNECIYDNRLGFCKSCGRTMQEISNWDRFDEVKKEIVRNNAKDRLTLNESL